MILNVKARIAVAMTIVLAVNILAGATSWWLNTQAVEHSAEARAAAVRAQWVGRLSEAVTTFVSESNDLAFGLDSDLSAEGSAEYGDVIGVDSEIAHLLNAAPDGVSQEDLQGVLTAWNALRTDVFVWVNAEAAGVGWPTRLKLMDNGQVRASVDTNIEVPARLAGMTSGDIRREVRQEYEAFRDRRLRAVMRAAEAEAADAQALETQARSFAAALTIALFAFSALVAAAAAIWLYRTIAAPLNRARSVADAVTAGDLDASFDNTANDEIGSLVHAVEAMRDTVVSRIKIMREMAGAVLVTSDGVTRAVGNALDAAEDIADPQLQSAFTEVKDRTQTLEALAAQMLDA